MSWQITGPDDFGDWFVHNGPGFTKGITFLATDGTTYLYGAVPDDRGYFPSREAAQTALDKYLKETQVKKREREVPYNELIVGQRCRIEWKHIDAILPNGEYVITKVFIRGYRTKDKEAFEIQGSCINFTANDYKFYETGSDEPQEKEQDMRVIKLYTTAIVKRAKAKEGEKIGDIIEVSKFQVKAADCLQDAIAERIDSDEKLKTSDVCGKATEFSTL